MNKTPQELAIKAKVADFLKGEVREAEIFVTEDAAGSVSVHLRKGDYNVESKVSKRTLAEGSVDAQLLYVVREFKHWLST